MSGPWEKYSGAPTDDAPADAKPWEAYAPKDAAAGTPKDLSWGDVGTQAIKNLPKSAKGAAEGIVQPIVHPIDTAKGFGDIASGVLSKLRRPTDAIVNSVHGLFDKEGAAKAQSAREAQRAIDEKGADAVGTYFGHRYGSVDGFKRALAEDPIGVAMDIGTLGSMGAGLPGKAGTVAKIARVVDPVGDIAGGAKALGKTGEVAGSHVLGHLTGGGPEAIRQAAKAGYQKETQFLDAIDQKMPPEDVVKWASSAIGKMRQERNANYQTLMKTVKADPTQLDFNKVLQDWQDAQKTGHFEGTPLSRPTEGLDKQLMDVLDDWYQKGQSNPKYFTAEGFDALKKAVGSIKENIPYERRTDRKYVGDLYNHIKGQIAQQAPVYSKIMKDYSQATEGLEEIERALSLGEKATYDTGIRKLLSAMRNNANTNYGNRLKMVDALEKAGGKGLKSALAGSQLSSGLPRGLAGGNPGKTLLGSLFQPGLLAALPLESPKLVGKGLYKAGQAGRKVSDTLSAVPGSGLAGAIDIPSLVRSLYQGGNVSEKAEDGR